MNECNLGETSFNNCHATCKYKGHEYDCPFIQEIEKEKYKNE